MNNPTTSRPNQAPTLFPRRAARPRVAVVRQELVELTRTAFNDPLAALVLGQLLFESERHAGAVAILQDHLRRSGQSDDALPEAGWVRLTAADLAERVMVMSRSAVQRDLAALREARYIYERESPIAFDQGIEYCPNWQRIIDDCYRLGLPLSGYRVTDESMMVPTAPSPSEEDLLGGDDIFDGEGAGASAQTDENAHCPERAIDDPERAGVPGAGNAITRSGQSHCPERVVLIERESNREEIRCADSSAPPAEEEAKEPTGKAPKRVPFSRLTMNNAPPLDPESVEMRAAERWVSMGVEMGVFSQGQADTWERRPKEREKTVRYYAHAIKRLFEEYGDERTRAVLRYIWHEQPRLAAETSRGFTWIGDAVASPFKLFKSSKHNRAVKYFAAIEAEAEAEAARSKQRVVSRDGVARSIPESQLEATAASAGLSREDFVAVGFEKGERVFRLASALATT